VKASGVRLALISGIRFRGREFAPQRPFARDYSSTTIANIGGERFGTLICAGAPATMWAAAVAPTFALLR